MLLDQLLEKKDLLIYIGVRKEHLQQIDITRYPPENREVIATRLNGRLRELDKLRAVIESGKLKDVDKRYYQQLKDDNGEGDE